MKFLRIYKSDLEREQKSFHEHLEYVLESNDKLKNIKEKAEKMSLVRDYIERYGCKNSSFIFKRK